MPSQDWLDEYPGYEDHVERKKHRRSVAAGRRISEKPTDIEIERGDEVLEAQTVRIEGRGSTLSQGTRDFTNSETYVRGITVFGLRGHPELPDLDVQVGDRFGYNGDPYIVTGVTPHAGEVQCSCDRYQP